MGLNELSPEWQYYIFRQITKEAEWKKLREKCPYYEPVHGECSKTGSSCSFEECPLRKGDFIRSKHETRVVLRRGSLLERDVARMFRLIGIEPQLNVRIDGYEIDVLVIYQGRKIAIECKQYEKSRPRVRNLIHEWHSKSKELGVHKVLLVIAGYRIREKDEELAKKYGITLWDEEKFDELFSEAIERREAARDKILLEIGIEPCEGYEEVVKNIKSKISPLLAYSSAYKAMKYFLPNYILFGWIIAGIIALLSPTLSFGQAIGYWLLIMFTLILLAIGLRYRDRRRICRGLLLALAEFHKVRETVTTEELASVSSLTVDEIEGLLEYLEKEGKVYSPYKGSWKLLPHLWLLQEMENL